MKFFGLLFISFAVVFYAKNIRAQQCSALGQTPSSALPVCGTGIYLQTNVPICSSANLYVPGCSGSSGANYENKNPFWYKFTCYQTGTFSFTLTPAVLSDDYDWQLYDVTGLDPNAVFTNRDIIVTGNWSGTGGPTGTSSSGVDFIQCGSDPAVYKNPFAKLPTIIKDHNYILLISHYTDSQSGYSLTFIGGSAVTSIITDPLTPKMKAAKPVCDGKELRIKMNKRMKCKTLAADGSDFKVITSNGTVLNVISSISDDCSFGFDFDSASVFLNTALTPGNYTLKIKNGSDGSTISDNCDNFIPVGDSANFTIIPILPTPMDSLTTPKCAPDSLVLVFKKGIKCSTIEPNGSDFFITGPYPISIIGASAICNKGNSNKIILKLSAPLQVGGTFFVNLKTGTDGNTIFDECDLQTPLPDDVRFVIKDTVNADFNFTINYTCALNTVNYFYPTNSVTNWNWTFGTTANSILPNPIIKYTNFEPTTASLIVSNGVCSDTASKAIVFDNYLNAGFEVTPVICPSNPANFKNISVGNITDWQWTFGNGIISTDKNPLPQNYIPKPSTDYNAIPELIITNNYGCNDTASQRIKVVYSCFIAVPTAFTPNSDGINDFLYPLKAYKSTNLRFSIYDRFGKRIFLGTDWQQKWDGKYKGVQQNPGTYVWTLEYTNIETNKAIFEKGTTILIR
jgi:gliding motility-associated-like protein